MSNRDLIFSIALHVVVIAVTIVSVPLAEKRPLPFDEVISVQLTAPASLPQQPIKPVSVPQPQVEEEPDLPVTQPKTSEEEAVIESKETKEPEKEKPKPKPQPKQEETQSQPDQGQTGEQPQDAGSPSETEVDAPTGEGSPFAGGATIDNANFNYPYWFTQTFNKIATNFRVRRNYPPGVTCVVYFEVIRSGRMIISEIKESSGYEGFDQACLAAVQESAPFPPLPRAFVDEVIGISVPFTPPQR